ncbi:MAG: hypothetical protein K6G08_05480 [Prevotella sp.]|nr:hypothetical protein [Prevotella sp.]
MSRYKILGVVTLYHPNQDEAIANVKTYLPHLDRLIIWDNSPLDDRLQPLFREQLAEEWDKVVWQGTGQNTCIAPAINHAWHHAQENGFHAILLMDDDSRWDDFPAYRHDVESHMEQGITALFTPYIPGCDQFSIELPEQEKRLCINSGTIIPTQIFNTIGGIDEDAFPLDAIDHHLSFAAREHGFSILCLTAHKLCHALGQPQRMGPFRIFTPNYDRHRTYSMTRSHIICYRMHRAVTTKEDRDYLYQEVIRRKFFRIILAEPDKLRRMWALMKGIVKGYRYKAPVRDKLV